MYSSPFIFLHPIFSQTNNQGGLIKTHIFFRLVFWQVFFLVFCCFAMASGSGSFFDRKCHQLIVYATYASGETIEGYVFRDLGSQYYLFQFFHEKDVARVERGVLGLLIDIL